MAIAAFIVAAEQTKFITSVMRGGISGENRLSGWYRSATPVIANNMAVSGPTRGTANMEGQTSKNWRSILVSILWTRLTLENWRAKLISLVTRDNGLVPNQKKRRGDTPGV